MLFVRAERRAAEPLLRLDYFRRRNVALPTAIQGVSVIPYMGTFFLAPFLFQEVLGYSTSRTALSRVASSRRQQRGKLTLRGCARSVCDSSAH